MRIFRAAALILLWVVVPVTVALLVMVPSNRDVCRQEAAATESRAAARAAIEKALIELLNDLDNDALSSEQRLGSIEKSVYKHFDLATLSRLVLSRGWRRSSKSQQDQYVSEFKPYISHYLACRFERYLRDGVEVRRACDAARGDVTVRTRTLGGDLQHSRIDFQMRNTGREWSVIDVSWEGVSLVSNLRERFTEVMHRGGPDHLLETLRGKNTAGTGCAGAD